MDMELNLSKTELERLLELTALGEWLLKGHLPDGGSSAPHDAVVQKMYALSDDEGLGYLIAVDEAADALKPSEALLSRLDHEIHEYDECVFWDELSLRLAERDLRAEMGAQVFEALSAAEREERVDAAAKRYDHEFDHRGVEGLQLSSERVAPRRRRDALSERLKKLFDEKGRS
jgi:hypothetical protein